MSRARSIAALLLAACGMAPAPIATPTAPSLPVSRGCAPDAAAVVYRMMETGASRGPDCAGCDGEPHVDGPCADCADWQHCMGFYCVDGEWRGWAGIAGARGDACLFSGTVSSTPDGLTITMAETGWQLPATVRDGALVLGELDLEVSREDVCGPHTYFTDFYRFPLASAVAWGDPAVAECAVVPGDHPVHAARVAAYRAAHPR